MKLSGIAIYCTDIDEAKPRWQKLLGIEPVREHHDVGPEHWSFTLDDGIVLELYPAMDRPKGVALLSFQDDEGRTPPTFRVLLTNREG